MSHASYLTPDLLIKPWQIVAKSRLFEIVIVNFWLHQQILSLCLLCLEAAACENEVKKVQQI